MKRLVKWLGMGFFGLALLMGVAVLYVSKVLPKVKPADQALKIEPSAQRIARGKYLATHVADCYSCHSTRDFSKYSGPVIAGSEYRGGDPVFDERIGLPGKLLPKNLTPYNLKNYSDGELVRVIRTGVRKNGEPLFPMMPYQNYAGLTQEDLYSIVAYLRTLKDSPNDVPEHELNFPVNLIVRTIPKEAGEYPAAPDPGNSVARGKYLVKIGSCADCHTPVDKQHKPLPGMYLAGGQEFPLLDIEGDLSPLAGAAIRTSNITPDMESGIGKLGKAEFIARFSDWRGKKGQAKALKLKNGEFQTVMPWLYYSGMSDSDLGAIYDYLRSIKPVKHQVVKFTPPKAI